MSAFRRRLSRMDMQAAEPFTGEIGSCGANAVSQLSTQAKSRTGTYTRSETDRHVSERAEVREFFGESEDFRLIAHLVGWMAGLTGTART